MKKSLQYILIIFLLAGIPGCDELVLDDEPDMSSQALFDQLWSDVDITYSYFELKNIDWNSIRAIYRPMVDENTTPGELFDIMAAMLNELRDGHVNLHGLGRRSAYTDWFTPFPKNYYPSVINNEYLSNITSTSLFKYGDLKGSNLGYIYIRNFGGSQSDFKKFGDILNRFSDKDGLVIDLRSNGGGSTGNSNVIGSHFTDESTIYAFYRYKNGPKHSDFTKWTAQRSKPANTPTYKKPVVMLTNRKCFSTTENFILEMRTLPQVTVVGDTTGGGAGNPIWRELPNGWTYRVSRWQAATPELRQYEGTGLYPDIPVWTTEADSASGIDRILDRAIQELNGQL